MTKAVTETDSAQAGTPALKLTGITKRFGSVTAVNNVSLEIRRNQVIGLIGENGAGKSTLLKILSGLYEPDAGVMGGRSRATGDRPGTPHCAGTPRPQSVRARMSGPAQTVETGL